MLDFPDRTEMSDGYLCIITMTEQQISPTYAG